MSCHIISVWQIQVNFLGSNSFRTIEICSVGSSVIVASGQEATGDKLRISFRSCIKLVYVESTH